MPKYRRCSFPRCDRIHEAHGYCAVHNKQFSCTGKMHEIASPNRDQYRRCSFGGCGREHHGGGYCRTHRRQLLTTGKVKRIKKARHERFRPLPRSPRAVVLEMAAEAAKRGQRISQAEIARRAGMSRSAACKAVAVLRRNGVPVPNVGKPLRIPAEHAAVFRLAARERSSFEETVALMALAGVPPLHPSSIRRRLRIAKKQLAAVDDSATAR
jgi:biotin operon repressor